jgi:hypothetical protein
MPMENISRYWGFDIKDLPDNAYLLRAIYVWDPHSPIIGCIPKPAGPPTAEVKAYQAQKTMALMAQLHKTGKLVKAHNNNHYFEPIMPHLKVIQQIVGTYKSIRFDMPKLQKNIGRAIEAADANPAVRSLLVQARIPEMMSHPGWQITDAHNKLSVEAMKREALEEEMTIEYIGLRTPAALERRQPVLHHKRS